MVKSNRKRVYVVASSKQDKFNEMLKTTMPKDCKLSDAWSEGDKTCWVMSSEEFEEQRYVRNAKLPRVEVL